MNELTMLFAPVRRALAVRHALAGDLVRCRSHPAAAHPAPFSYLDIVYRNGGIDGTLVIHIIDAAHELTITPADSAARFRRARRTAATR